MNSRRAREFLFENMFSFGKITAIVLSESMRILWGMCDLVIHTKSISGITSVLFS